MPLTGERKRAYDKRKAKQRRAGHRKAVAAGVPGTPPTPHGARPNAFDLSPLDLQDPSILDHITHRAYLGYPDIAIAKAVGMTLPAWRKHCEQFPQFPEAVAAGRALEELRYVDNLRRMADDPEHPASCTANIFLLKARAGYSDRPDKVRVVNQQNNFFTALPAQQSMDDYVRSLPAATPALPAKVPT